MSAPAELHVLLDGRVIGSLTRSQTGMLRFRYADEWLDDSCAYPVSLALPLAAREYQGPAIRNWLRGLIPDNEAHLAAIEAEYAASRDDPYAVLANVGEDCVGAVQFAAPDRAAEIAAGRTGGGVEWLDEATLETLLREVASRSLPHHRALRTGQFSLPGALGKVALVWDEAGARWGRSSGKYPSTHILKPPLPGLAFHNENEHFCLRLAEAAGLAAARSRVVRFGAQGAIAVERYDRERRGDGSVARLHQEDMAQALGLDPSLKYAAEGGAGIREIVKLVRDHARPSNVGDFVQYVGFAWISAGTDAHLRNYAVCIHPGAKAELAPLYDLSSAFGLVQRRSRLRGLRLAMAIGGLTALGDIDRAAWEREVARSRLPRGSIADVADLARRVAREAAPVAERLADEEGLDGKYLRKLARAIQARANGCSAILGRSQI